MKQVKHPKKEEDNKKTPGKGAECLLYWTHQLFYAAAVC